VTLARQSLCDIAFRLHCLNRDATNVSLLRHRDFQGFLVTGQHSGTHWIKWMLSHAIAHHYGVPPPRYFANASSNDIIGHPRHPRLHPQLPRIASSHSIAPYALQWRWLRRRLCLPPYALVVRDIRDVLVSAYEKWRDLYQVSFAEFLKGDPRAKKYVADVWIYMHFMNRWGEIARRYPEETLVVKYEEVRADAPGALKKIARHFGLGISGAAIAAGVAAGSKEFMARHHDPNVDERALRPDGAGDTRYSAEDTALLEGILARHLRYDFGYGLPLRAAA
jgi:hypothetical protein